MSDILRPDKTIPSVVVSHSDDNKLQDLMEQDTSLCENHFKDVLIEEQGDETNKNVCQQESRILLEQEIGTNEELLNEIEVFLQQEKIMNEYQKRKELVNEIEINSDARSVEPSNATFSKVEDYRSSEENTNLSMKNETSGTTDSWRTDSAGSSTEEDIKDLESTQFPDYADDKNLTGGSGCIMSSAEEMVSKNEQIPISLEHIVVKEDNKICQVTDGSSEQQKLNSSNDSKISSVNCTEYSLEDSTVLQTTQVTKGAGEQNSNAGNNSKVPEVVNAGLRTEDSLEECKVSQTTQVPEGTDEENSSSQINSNGAKNLEKSIEVSNEDTSDEEISNYRESSPKEGRITSKQVNETIAWRLNSEEINGIVQKLTTVEFISPHISPEDMEALEELKNEQIPVLLEHIVVKEDYKVCQIADGPAEEQNLNSSNDSAVSQTTQIPEGPGEQNSNSGNDSKVSLVVNTGTSTEDSLEDFTVSQTTEVPEGAGEQNYNAGNDTKVSVVVNAGQAGTSTEDSRKECKVSQSTQVPEGTDEGNSSSQINSNGAKYLEKSTYDSNEDTSDEEISNYRKSSPKEGRITSKQVTEIISRRLNSEEYKKKLSDINDIVKKLTAVEFISPHLSPEDMEALEELYSHQDLLEEDWEKYSEVSESNAMKRKSKETSELDEEEDFLATSKKCKISKESMDSWLLSGATSCCLEEQFRLACELSKEDNEGQSQREKEYKFPITESVENPERKYKLCKHQIAKIDAMIVSAMSMEIYLSQFNDAIDSNELSTEDLSSNEFSVGKSAFLDNLSNVPKSVSSSAGTRKFSNKNVARQQKSFHNEELISQPNEQLAVEKRNHTGYGYFGLGEVFNSIKNLILFVSFTGSLAIAITVAKICGVTFPVPKSQNNLSNDSMSSLQEFPDINLDES